MTLERRSLLTGAASFLAAGTASGGVANAGYTLANPFAISPARQQPLSPTPTPSAIPFPRINLVLGQSKYDPGDPTRSQVDPAQKQSLDERLRPLRDFGIELAKLANAYAQSSVQKQEKAYLAASMLAGLATQDALAGPKDQPGYNALEQPLAGMAMNYLAIKDAVGLSPAQKQVIEQWLLRRAGEIRSNMERGAGEKTRSNNHRYWAGLVSALAGLAANDVAAYRWGIESAMIGIDQITPGGTLPLEMERGQKAQDYHVFAAAPLNLLAVIDAANGGNLWERNSRALARLDKAVIAAANGAPVFGPGQDPVSPSRYGFLQYYAERYPNATDAAAAQRLAGNAHWTSVGGYLPAGSMQRSR